MAKEKGYRWAPKEGMRVVLCPTDTWIWPVPVRSFLAGGDHSACQRARGPRLTGGGGADPGAGRERIMIRSGRTAPTIWRIRIEALRRETFEPWLAEQPKQALEELDRDPREVRLFGRDQYWLRRVPGTVVTWWAASPAMAGAAAERGAPGADERLFL
ncbi:MAG: hypothetical protein ACLT5P_08615 [Flavonifractor plautii]